MKTKTELTLDKDEMTLIYLAVEAILPSLEKKPNMRETAEGLRERILDDLEEMEVED